MNKAVAFSSFSVATLLVIVVFITSSTYPQLALATLLYVPLSYFGYRLFRAVTTRADELEVSSPSIVSAQPVAAAKTSELVDDESVQKLEIVDIDKRAFLKLVGGLGLSFFIFSLFGRRLDNLLVGQPKDLSPAGADSPSGAGITDGYQIAEIEEGDDSTYYGFTNKNGAWLIMRDTDTNSYRYAKGDSDFPANWAKREKLEYDYYYNVL